MSQLDSVIGEVRRLKRWVTNFRLTGDGVTGKNGADGAAFIIKAQSVNAPPTTSQPVRRVQITGLTLNAITCGFGRYAGSILNEHTGAFTIAANTIASDFGNMSQTCLVINMAEINGTGNWLDPSDDENVFLGQLIGSTDTGEATPSVPVVAIWALQKGCG